MGNIRISNEELERIHVQFLTDPIIKGINKEIMNIMEHTIPTIILNDETKEIKYKYPEVVEYKIQEYKKYLDDYIKSHYPIMIDIE